METVRNVYWDSFAQFRSFYKRVLNFGNEMMKGYWKVWIFQSFHGLVAIGSLVSFILAMAFAYMYLFPTVPPVVRSYGISNSGSSNSSSSVEKCNVYEGSWIADESYPLYNASLCPFAERGFNCLANGREDRGYAKWRWKPKNCDIPRFDARKVLEGLRGKRVVFVGDSLSRTQWESLICLLMTGVEDKKSVYEVNGNKITKQIRFLSVRFATFDLRMDFYRSVFLVQRASKPAQAPKRVKSTLRIDRIDDISKEWIDSDILIFNSGHWWTPSKLFELGCYFQVGKSLKLGMPITTAFKKAMNTWASWVETTINTNRTSVFFRTFESSHWSGRHRHSCKVGQRPWLNSWGMDQSPVSDTIIKVVREMAVPVTIMHVTPMGAFRSDGHVGIWSDNPSVPDCSHWCLPGVPDMWNEILLSYLLP
ncbi:protein trichome berefringence-like 7 [Rosa sericea]